jgi:hypothetical protein
MRKKLQLEILDPVGNVATTHHFFYVAGQGNRLRLTITDNTYIMDKDGKLVILTQEEMDREASRKEPKYFNPETQKTQKLFCEEVLVPTWTVKYEDPYVGNKGEAVYMTVSAKDELEAETLALACSEFSQHITPNFYNARYLTAFRAEGNYKIGEVKYFEGDPRL